MSSETFTHTVTGSGPAAGMTVTGRRIQGAAKTAEDVPLVIAIHGGTYTSEYFDIEGYSLIARAETVGIPLIALDRPGYGGTTPVERSDSIILKNAEVLDEIIGELWQANGEGTAGVFLIGHSIGGAVVTALAARHPSWPLLGISVSGCLLEVPTEAREGFNSTPDVVMMELPSPMKDGLMFGPPWTYSAGMPEASHPSDAPVPRDELIDINNGWIERVRSVNAEVRVPVYARQAEFDYLWKTDAEQVSHFAESFSGSPRVDAQLLPSAGHCIDFHRAAAAFQLGQLGFALECSIAAVKSELADAQVV